MSEPFSTDTAPLSDFANDSASVKKEAILSTVSALSKRSSVVKRPGLPSFSFQSNCDNN